MAGADVIEAAIGITLLLIVSYVVVGSITTAADTVSAAQKDMALSQEQRLGTSVMFGDYHYESSYWNGAQTVWPIHFRVLNNGNQIISKPKNMQVMLLHGSNLPLLYNYGSVLGTTTWYYDGYFDIDIWETSEIMNPGQWDPGEYIFGQFEVNFQPNNKDWLQVVLENGVSAMTTSDIYWD
jgi:hypothetical protein